MPNHVASQPRLSLGQTVITANAMAQLSHEDVLTALSRHIRGEWGDLCREDWQANEDALVSGGRLLSVYHAENKLKFYVITEWDRSVTTVLLPEDY